MNITIKTYAANSHAVMVDGHKRFVCRTIESANATVAKLQSGELTVTPLNSIRAY